MPVIKELEFGGVWTIGNYENIRLSVRYVVNSEEDAMSKIEEVYREVCMDSFKNR